jgi:hypothetical protein
MQRHLWKEGGVRRLLATEESPPKARCSTRAVCEIFHRVATSFTLAVLALDIPRDPLFFGPKRYAQ